MSPNARRKPWASLLTAMVASWVKRVEPDMVDVPEESEAERRFDELLQTEESLRLLERLAQEALEAYLAGRTLPLDELLELIRDDEPCE